MTLAHDVAVRGDWLGAWELNPVLTAVLMLAGILYWIGFEKLRARPHRPRALVRRAAAFYAALGLTVVVLISPIHSLAGTFVSAHMVQHVALVLVIAPLLVWGRSSVVMMTALPPSWRTVLARPQLGGRWPTARRILARPAVVAALGAGGLWAWHLPALYESALESTVVHGLEHATYLLLGLLYWRVVFGARSVDRYGPAIALSFVTGLVSAALGAVLTFASAPLYPTHAGRSILWGVPPLADQQLAGLIMWVPMGVLYGIVMTRLALAWMRHMDRRTSRAQPARSLNEGERP